MKAWRRPSALILIAACLISSYSFSNRQVWKERAVIDWDITQYYYYLPALFIYQDLGLTKDPSPEWGQRHFELKENEAGQRVAKMTGGLAILYSPFFAAAHLYALNSNTYTADGFSEPYRVALLLSSLFFALVGLYFLRRLLLNFFGEWATVFTLLCVFLGSNMLHYTMVEPMSHVYNFFLISFIYWAFFKHLEKNSLGWLISIGLAAGLLVLIRPTNVLALLLPSLYLLFRPQQRPHNWPIQLLICALVAIIPVLPQLFYWHHMTGQWIVYSYGEEGFFFSDPEIWSGLFSYRKGWFVYSPVLLLALPGFFLLQSRNAALNQSMIITLSLVLWITFSWWCWWYGGSFGMRVLIDYLPLMALAIAALFHFSIERARPLLWPLLLTAGFLCHWSLTMQKQYYFSVFHWDSMSKELFWAQFYNFTPVENYQDLLDPPNYDAALKNEDQ